jgi:hypothetical protein
MTQLITILSTGKGSWSQVIKLMTKRDWDSIILITNKFGKEKFTPNEKTTLIECDFDLSTDEIKKDLVQKLNNKITGLEVATNITSGTGKEHMAVISALLMQGVGLRFVDMVNDKITEI